VPPIYHITHVDNLPGIIKGGGLYCDRDAQKITFVNIAHQNIKGRRLTKKVPVGPKGVIADYVPFYFAPRSPMLFVINKGGVAGYTAGQQPIIYLCSTTEAVDAAGLSWVFTEGQAVMNYTDFFDNFKDLNQIDWNIMKEKYWRDTDEDGDRCRRRQAEFLVHNFFPWRLVAHIGVCDSATAEKLSRILGGKAPAFSIQPGWYYQ
jgi:hypothetical protein